MIAFIILISRSDWIIGKYLQIEARFLANFNEKNLLETEQAKSDKSGEPHHNWISEQLLVAEYSIEKDSKEIGLEIKSLEWGRKYKVNIIKIISGEKHINIPEGGYKFHENDTIFLLGTKDQIDVFEFAAVKMYENLERKKDPVILREFILSEENKRDENQLFCYAIAVKKGQHFEGRNLKDSNMRTELHCNIIGVQRGGYPIIYPDVEFIINNGDRIWLLGDRRMVSSLIKKELIQVEEHGAA
jgi:CPA2 family monovalent cation:H+ antiporter-2